MNDSATHRVRRSAVIGLATVSVASVVADGTATGVPVRRHAKTAHPQASRTNSA
jgi:hypothetical protein